MRRRLRIAFFAEGGVWPPAKRGDPFVRLWRETIPEFFGLVAPARVVPISKRHLVAMDPKLPKMSGAGEPLDALMARELQQEEFDTAVVLWDLVPAWDERARACRWEDMLALYKGLAASEELPAPWRENADARLRKLRERGQPALRTGVPAPAPATTLAVCMEPVFEGLLVQDENLVRRALGVRGRHVPGWPSPWSTVGVTRPDLRLLQPAIIAARKLRPAPRVLSQVRGDMRSAKHDWDDRILQVLMADASGRKLVLAHPLARRLCEMLAVRCDGRG